MNLRPALAAVALATAGAATVLGGTAAAVDDTKPDPCGGAYAQKDAVGDQVATPGANGATDTTDIIGLFFKHDPAKGAEATTFNLAVKDMKPAVPSGFTSQTWNVVYTTADETQRFVRAVLDFSGDLAFEFGTFRPAPENLTSVSQYEGVTTGKVFEGAAGLMQIVVPADRGGKAGDKSSTIYATTTVGRTAPNEVGTPTRGLASQVDETPDTAPESKVTFTATPCADGTAPAPPATPGAPPSGGGGGTAPPQGGDPAGPGPGTPAQPGPAQPQGGPPALSVKLLTKKVAAKKVKKALKLKLSATEAYTAVAAQLRSTKATLGLGKAKAFKKGKNGITIKLKKKLKKGRYVIDVRGTDAQGRGRVAAFKFTVR